MQLVVLAQAIVVNRVRTAPAGSATSTVDHFVPSQRRPNAFVSRFVRSPTARQKLAVGHATCDNWLWEPPSGGGSVVQLDPSKRAVTMTGSLADAGVYPPIPTHGVGLTHDTALRPTPAPGIVSQLVPFHFVTHEADAFSVAAYPVVRQLAGLVHETPNGLASPPSRGTAMDSRDHFEPFHRKAYGRELRPNEW